MYLNKQIDVNFTLKPYLFNNYCPRIVNRNIKVFEMCTNFYFETEKIPSKF